MNFVTGLPISANWKRDSYDFIIVIIDQPTKIIYYKLIKITFDIPELTNIIIDIVIWHHGLANSIVTNRD